MEASVNFFILVSKGPLTIGFFFNSCKLFPGPMWQNILVCDWFDPTNVLVIYQKRVFT